MNKCKKYIYLIFIFLSIMVNLVPVKTLAMDDMDFNIDIDGKVTMSSGITQNGQDILDESVSKDVAWNLFIDKYKVLITGFMGAATLTMVGIGMFVFVKLGLSASSPNDRAQATKWVGVLLLAAGLLGSATAIFAYTYGVFRV